MTANPYVGAYPLIPKRAAVWREIARYVERDAPDCNLAIELGAGYCDFINQFSAAQKLAFDLNPEMSRYAGRDVQLRITDAIALPGVDPDSADLIFASNFLEHLEQAQLAILLPRVRESLSARGRFIVLQPNHARCADHYFDDPTHVTIFSDANLGEIFERHGLRMLKLVPGFLPFSMNSRLPKSAVLTRVYLHSPWKPLAAQMYAVAGKA